MSQPSTFYSRPLADERFHPRSVKIDQQHLPVLLAEAIYGDKWLYFIIEWVDNIS